jgi:hypothetical protein
MPNFSSRFTVRRLMVAVAFVGMALGVIDLWKRRERFGRRAALLREAELFHRIQSTRWDAVQEIEAADWLGRLADKYERAARYPWLPVAPDPPEPEWQPMKSSRSMIARLMITVAVVAIVLAAWVLIWDWFQSHQGIKTLTG